MRRGHLLTLMLTSLAAGAGCTRYQPAPLDPVAHAAAYRARRLDDPVLLAWMRRYAELPDGGPWNSRQLALVALAHRADVERARRDWLAAGAAVNAAAGRPAPGAEIAVERAVGGREESSPWVVALSGLLTVELGGKRGARLQAARARETIAAAELARRAGETMSRVRETVLALTHAEQALADATEGLRALRVVAELEQGRYAEASLGRGELARTATEVVAAEADRVQAEGAVLTARAALAGALAIPVAQIGRLAIVPPVMEGCAWAATVGGDSVAAFALSRRPEVAHALGEYAAAEADVRAEVAARFPSLELGPGFIWDQGVHRWTLVAALPSLLGLRSRAPIAAAGARRRAAAAGVAEVQDALLAEVGRAVEACRGAELERVAADSQQSATARLAGVERAAFERGETGRLELSRADLLQSRAAAGARRALRRLERAGLELELVSLEWRETVGSRWPDPGEEPLTPPQEGP